MSEWIEIGTIVAAQGLRGEVRVYPNSDFPERFLEPGQRWLRRTGQDQPQPIEFLGGRLIPSKGLYVVEIAGVENREQAEALQGCQLLITEADRPQLEDDEFYVPDLLGLEVFHQQWGESIGRIVAVIPAGNDLLEVQLHDKFLPTPPVDPATIMPESAPSPHRRHRHKRQKRKPAPSTTILIPFVMEIVPVVDLKQGRVEITPPPGLLEFEPASNSSSPPVQ